MGHYWRVKIYPVVTEIHALKQRVEADPIIALHESTVKLLWRGVTWGVKKSQPGPLVCRHVATTFMDFRDFWPRQSESRVNGGIRSTGTPLYYGTTWLFHVWMSRFCVGPEWTRASPIIRWDSYWLSDLIWVFGGLRKWAPLSPIFSMPWFVIFFLGTNDNVYCYYRLHTYIGMWILHSFLSWVISPSVDDSFFTCTSDKL